MPNSKHMPLNTINMRRTNQGISCCVISKSLRGLPRIVIPAIFTKAKAVSPKVRARSTIAMIMTKADNTSPGMAKAFRVAKRLCKINHSLIKPFNGGNPAIAIAPNRKADAVQGKILKSPPNPRYSTVSASLSIAPVDR